MCFLLVCITWRGRTIFRKPNKSNVSTELTNADATISDVMLTGSLFYTAADSKQTEPKTHKTHATPKCCKYRKDAKPKQHKPPKQRDAAYWVHTMEKPQAAQRSDLQTWICYTAWISLHTVPDKSGVKLLERRHKIYKRWTDVRGPNADGRFLLVFLAQPP